MGKNVFLERFLLTLLFFGLILNLLKNRLYDNDWTVGEWLISYPGSFIRRGLIGKLIYIFSKNLQINPIYFIWFICIFIWSLSPNTKKVKREQDKSIYFYYLN